MQELLQFIFVSIDLDELFEAHASIEYVRRDKSWRIVVVEKHMGKDSFLSLAFRGKFWLPDELHLLGSLTPSEVVIVDSCKNHLFEAHFRENRCNRS